MLRFLEQRQLLRTLKGDALLRFKAWCSDCGALLPPQSWQCGNSALLGEEPTMPNGWVSRPFS